MTTVRSPLYALLFVLSLTVVSAADVPTSMNLQGRLLDSSGNPAPAGSRTFIFRIYDDQTAGTEIWPGGPGEAQAISTDAAGLWNAAVGAVTPLTDAVFQDTSRWLQVTIDDGVNPPETISRIKLNTGPYSYRAASAQNADAVGGYAIGDLDGRYVQAAGDSMTGLLVVSAPNKALPGATLRANNVSDLNGPTVWGANTIGIAADAASDGTEGKFGVIGVAKGSSGVTAGLYGFGNGTGSYNIGVNGFAFPAGAAENFSGLFEGGDFAVMSPATPGDSAVRLPDDAVSSAELQNEPGLSQELAAENVFVTGATVMMDVATTSITTPASGYVVVEASGSVFWSGTTGANLMNYQIDETAGGDVVPAYYQQSGQITPSSGDVNAVPFVVRRTFFKDAGTHTFRLEANDLTLDGSKGFFNTVITAMYIPTGYGTVSTVVAAGNAGGFESARAVVVGGVPGVASGATMQTSYAVDLRELELRAARARAEAQKADLELARARYEALVKSVSPGSSPK